MANSESMNLNKFYADHSDLLVRLYDGEHIVKLLSASRMRETHPLEYYMMIFKIRGNGKFLTTAIDERGSGLGLTQMLVDDLRHQQRLVMSPRVRVEKGDKRPCSGRVVGRRAGSRRR